MRVIAVLMCVLALVGCQKEPPAYESRYTDAPATSSLAGPAPPQAGFVDDFNRPDTTHGLGEGWLLRGPYAGSFPMPPATDGFIKGGRYTYAGDAVVYAAREFPNTVRRVGTIGRWSKLHDGPETAIALVISANDNLVTDMVHLVVSRHVWTLTVRRATSGDGSFEPVANGTFAPPLAMGRDYSFELEAGDDTVTVRMPGLEPVISSVPLAGVVGPYAFWEEYSDQLPAGTVFEFDSVWADYG